MRESAVRSQARALRPHVRVQHLCKVDAVPAAAGNSQGRPCPVALAAHEYAEGSALRLVHFDPALADPTPYVGVAVVPHPPAAAMFGERTARLKDFWTGVFEAVENDVGRELLRDARRMIRAVGDHAAAHQVGFRSGRRPGYRDCLAVVHIDTQVEALQGHLDL